MLCLPECVVVAAQLGEVPARLGLGVRRPRRVRVAELVQPVQPVVHLHLQNVAHFDGKIPEYSRNRK